MPVILQQLHLLQKGRMPKLDLLPLRLGKLHLLHKPTRLFYRETSKQSQSMRRYGGLKIHTAELMQGLQDAAACSFKKAL